MEDVVLNELDIKILEMLLRENAVSETTGHSIGLLERSDEVTSSISSIRRSIERLQIRGYVQRGIRVKKNNTYYATLEGLDYYKENMHVLPSSFRDRMGIEG